ncbi:hypothetical protein LTR36_000208, partial [Oleoguttula mirabilis]
MASSSPHTRDHYTHLSLPQTAAPAAIHAAFRRLALLHHPDKGGNAATFRRTREAQET